MAPLRVGFVGAGFIANFQLTAMRQGRGLELAAVLNRKGAAALAVRASALGVGTPRLCATIAEVARQVDVVALYCPNHIQVAAMEELVAAVRAGAEVKAVICEKPLGRTVAEARRLVALARDANLRTAYFENQIFMPPLRTQLAQLERVRQAMGPLTLARTAEEHGGPHEPWFWDPRRQGGGVLRDMGCHSIGAAWWALTPAGKPLTFLEPQSVSADIGLLKWGRDPFRSQLLSRCGVDYAQHPAEDFATGVVTFKNPETGQRVKAQFTNSWMFDKQGLRLFMEGFGPGYAFEVNTLTSPLSVFIGDAAAAGIMNAEHALEKSTSARGLMALQSNEPDLYGYVDENTDAAAAFAAGRDAALPLEFGLEVTRLVSAAYLAAETRRTVDLTEPATAQALETYESLIQQGKGAEVLFR